MKKNSIVSLMLLTFLSLFGESINLNNVKNETIYNLSDSEIIFSVLMDEVELSSVTKKGTTYQNISFNDWKKTDVLGAPRLPQKSFLVAVPQHGKISTNLSIISKKRMEILPVYPSQRPHIDGKFEYDVETFTKNQTYYQATSFPSDFIQISEPFTVRGVKIQRVTIVPFRYEPQQNELLILDQFELSMNISGSQFANERLITPYWKSYFNSAIINNQWLQNVASRSRETGADMIIFSMYEFEEITVEFSKWKNQLGISTEIYYVDDFDFPKDEMQALVQMAYDGWDLPPSFLTIIGDTELIECYQIPSLLYDDQTVGTDRIFACMDGAYDYHPDIAYGRISVDNVVEAETVINKIIEYEKNPPTEESFYNNAQVCAYFQDELDQYDNENPDGWEDRRFIKTAEEIRDFLLTKDKDVDRVYITDYSVTPTHYSNYYADGSPIPAELLRSNGFQWDGNENDIRDNINAGNFMVVHRDHGISQNYTYDSGANPSFSGWGDPYFSSSLINTLENGNKLPFVFSINCQTGWFDSEIDYDPSRDYESFAEVFLRKENGGAIGVYGACRNSLSGYNDVLINGMFDAMWDDYSVEYDYHSPGHMGMVLQNGLIAMEEIWSTDDWSRYEFDIFNLFGDPSMRVWRSEPQEITADLPSSLYINDTSIPITTNIDEGLATITYDGQLLGEVYFTTNTFELEIIDSIPQPGECTITISQRDMKPFTQALFAAPPSGAYLIAQDFQVSDITGNGDNENDAGEIVQLSITIENIGNESSTNGSLSMIENPYFSFETNNLNVLPLMQNETAICALNIQLNADLDHNQTISFETILTSDGNTSNREFAFSITKKPKINIEEYEFSYEDPSYNETETVLIENDSALDINFRAFTTTNKGYDLQGDNTYLAYNHNPFANTSEFTIEWWANNLEGSNTGDLFYYGDSIFELKVYSPNVLMLYYTDTDGSAASQVFPSPTQAIDSWRHYALVFTESNAKIYINGTFIYETEEPIELETTGSHIYIGADSDGNNEFNGLIDDIHFHQTALTEDEIIDSMNSLKSYIQDENILNFSTENQYLSIFGEPNYILEGAPKESFIDFSEESYILPSMGSLEIPFTLSDIGLLPNVYETQIIITSDEEEIENIEIPFHLTITTSNEVPVPTNSFILFPNPVKSSKELTYKISLERNNEAEKIDIFNIRGQKIRTISTSDVTSSKGSVIWDLKDSSGTKVPSGVYFSRLKTKRESVIKKSLILH